MAKREKKKKTNKTAPAASQIGLLHSIRFKILLLVVVAVALTAFATLAVIVPIVQNTIREQMGNYMYDVVSSNGAVLEEIEENGDYDNYIILSKTFSTVGLQGVKSSQAYIVDQDGTYKYHQDTDLAGTEVKTKAVQDMVKDLQRGKRSDTAVIHIKENGKTNYLACYVTKKVPAILVICAEEAEIMQPVTNVLYLSILVFVIVVVVLGIAATILANVMVRPIKKVSDMIGRMADMDFTDDGNMEKLQKRKDETGLMGRAVAGLRNEMNKMVSQIQEQSQQLFGASERLDQDASTTTQTAVRVGEAVGDIASGAGSQADETQSATEHVISMGNMIQETNRVAEELEENSRQMQASSEQAMGILQELIAVNEQTRTSIQEIAEQTNITNASAQKIKEATSIITAIAEETNLLALNASIEAARAGEQGKGFAVVALQIQKLAEQSNDSASQIDAITSELIHDSTTAVETMQEVRDVMELQSDKMARTDEVFHKVNQGVEGALQGVVQITDRTENLDESRSRVVEVVQSLSAIAEQNAAGSEETSASMSEMEEILKNISGNATKLKDIAYQLDQSVRNIKI